MLDHPLRAIAFPPPLWLAEKRDEKLIVLKINTMINNDMIINSTCLVPFVLSGCVCVCRGGHGRDGPMWRWRWPTQIDWRLSVRKSHSGTGRLVHLLDGRGSRADLRPWQTVPSAKVHRHGYWPVSSAPVSSLLHFFFFFLFHLLDIHSAHALSHAFPLIRLTSPNHFEYLLLNANESWQWKVWLFFCDCGRTFGVESKC